MSGVLRRQVLAGGAAATVGAAVGAGGVARAQPGGAELAALAGRAYGFVLPALELLRVRDATVAAGGANRFQHRRTLAGPKDRLVTTPNNDTLYSSAFLDLRQGPVSVGFPATGARYLSLHLMDSWTNAIEVAGTRVDKGRAGRLLVATEAQAATLRPGPGTRVVVSPTRWVWALGRVLTDGGEDLKAAAAVQDGLSIDGRAGAPPPRVPPREATAAQLAAGLRAPIADAGVLPGDRGAALGLLRAAGGMDVDFAALAARPEVQAGVDAARAALTAAGRQQTYVGGWSYPKPNLGVFGTDYAYRAAVAVWGLGALPREEAMYMRAAGDGDTGLFDGRRSYRLDLPPLPLDGFWSLSLYEPTADGGLYFVENPLGRYAIGDRTPGLVRGADGGVSLRIGAAEPGGADVGGAGAGAAGRANWLPAPAGPFALILRAYLPRRELLSGRFRLPAVVAG